MAAIKTKQEETSFAEYVKAIPEETKKKEAEELHDLMKKATKEEPRVWSNGVVGYGTFHYKSERSKQEGEWFMTGFSMRKANITVYIIPGFGKYKDLLKKLGKFKTSSGSCLLINKLADVDKKVLKELVSAGYKDMKAKYSKTK